MTQTLKGWDIFKINILDAVNPLSLCFRAKYFVPKCSFFAWLISYHSLQSTGMIQ